MNRRKYGTLVNRRAWRVVLLVLAVGLLLVVGASLKPDPAFREGPSEEQVRLSDQDETEGYGASRDDGPEAESAEPVIEGESFPVFADGPVSEDTRPQLALLVDDFGYNVALAERLALVDLPITWSILPYLQHTNEIVALAGERGIPYLLHLPMQAEIDGEDGPFLVGPSMGSEQIRRVVRDALSSVPGISGINNHRGSRATSDAGTMDAVLDVISEEELFFVDSRTSSRSVGYARARARGIPSLYNGIFLDNKSEAEYISQKLAVAIAKARREGWALAICHVRPGTVDYLETLASDPPEDVRFVTVPELVSQYGLR